MDNSVLDKIIRNQQAEEVNRLNAVEIVGELFNELTKRERDILMRRYGLHGKGPETLESVGNAYQLTRERIRQIENFSIKKLRELDKLEEYVKTLKNVIHQLLEEHGGLMEKAYLLDVLINFSTESDGGKSRDKNLHKNHLDFLVSKLLHDHFEEINTSRFKKSYKFKYKDLDPLEEIAEEAITQIGNLKKLQKTEDLIKIFNELESYNKHKEKFNVDQNLDISGAIDDEWYDENYNVVNQNKVFYSILRALKHVDQNKFGYWGMYNWPEINPKKINDKIHLVLKENGEPMHFVDIAKRINEISFDHKKANPATVHNELILDSQYVLVGRGIYGLKKWGYKKGTVADVIREILKESEEPLTQEDITNKVLEKRMVKNATINLALVTNEEFEKINGDKYRIKKD